MADCTCHIAAAFPHLGGLGIISATLRANTNITIAGSDASSGLILYGPTLGDLSITAYAALDNEVLECPGSAGIGFGWDQRIDCDSSSDLIVYFIPRGRNISHTEGSVTNKIRMDVVKEYDSFNASAASGPHTPYLYTEHRDGYNFSYSGNPISIDENDWKGPKTVGFLQATGILPLGSKLYLTNFSWNYSPPNVPTVSYSFIFSYTGD